MVIGPGAIGCALAAALIEAGHRPILAGRGTFDRLEVDHLTGSVSEPVEVATRADQLAPAPLVVLATKTYQTAATAPLLAATCGPRTRLLIAQNGITHRERLASMVTEGVELVPTIVSLPATRHGPGRVSITGTSRLEVPDSRAGREAASWFASSYLAVTPTDDWPTAAWTKLILNAALGAMGVLSRQANSVFLEDDEGRAFTRALMAEIVPVARAEGATLDDDVPDRLIRRVRGHAAGHLSSITVDRLGGSPTEWQDRNEIIGILARRHGLATPLNDFATALLRLGEVTAPG